MASGTCATCRNEASELFKGECRTCYSYRWRTGTERSEDLAIRHARRYNERVAEQELYSRYSYGR